MEIPGGTRVRCPLCRDEETVLKRNKKNRPYFTCTTLMTTVNCHTPMADEFMKEFVVEEDSEGDVAERDEVSTLDGEDADVGQDESADEESGDETTIEDLFAE